MDEFSRHSEGFLTLGTSAKHLHTVHWVRLCYLTIIEKSECLNLEASVPTHHLSTVKEVIPYSELSNKRTAGNNRTADPEVMKLIIGPQVLIGPQD